MNDTWIKLGLDIFTHNKKVSGWIKNKVVKTLGLCHTH